MNGVFAFVSGRGLVTGVFIAIVSMYVGHILSKRRERSREHRSWRNEALGLVAEFQLLGRRVTEYQKTPDYGQLQEDLYNKAEEINKHAEKAPTKQDWFQLRSIAVIGTSLDIIIAQLETNDLSTIVEEFHERIEDARSDDSKSFDPEFSMLFGEDSPIDIIINADIESMGEEWDEETIEAIGERLREDLPDEMLESDDDIDGMFKNTEEAIDVASGFPFADFGEHIDQIEDDAMRELIRIMMIDVPDIIYQNIKLRA